MADTAHEEPGGVMHLADEFDPQHHTGSLKVLDLEGQPIAGADISLAATSVLTGLHRVQSNQDGFVFFGLPVKAGYVLAIRFGDLNEVLYMENLQPNVDYMYQPDPEIRSGRADALIPQPA
jgi:hypothetical protein